MTHVEQIPTGRYVDSKEIIAVTLRNATTTATFLNYGVILQHYIVVNKKGRKQDIVLGFDTVDGYLSPEYLASYPYFGAVIGRYANRVSDAEFTVNDTTYKLPENNGKVCLHGGWSGFDKKVWEVIKTEEESVIFEYLSPAGEEGFPGNLRVRITVTLTTDDALVFDFSATTDAVTAVNLTHHSYFNLNPAGGTIATHLHVMPAANYLEQDANFAATGNLIPVTGTGHDFTVARPIGSDWQEGTGYDQSFVLDKEYGRLTLAACTQSPDKNIQLEIFTTEPVAHFYTARYLNVDNGKGGRTYGPFEAFCVETQHHPNAVNVAGFPSTILHPGEVYHQTTVYKAG